METERDAWDFAKLHHAGQVDKAGVPYSYHLERVAMSLPPGRLRAAGLLHDVVEDAGVSIATIRERFGADVARIVDAVSRRPHEVYSDYILRLADDMEAVKVKKADLRDNLDPDRKRPAGLGELLRRYKTALAFLESL